MLQECLSSTNGWYVCLQARQSHRPAANGAGGTRLRGGSPV